MQRGKDSSKQAVVELDMEAVEAAAEEEAAEEGAGEEGAVEVVAAAGAV